MKNTNIKTINTLGKISSVIISLASIAVIGLIVGCLIISVASFTFPKTDFINGTGSATATINVISDNVPWIMESDIEYGDSNGSFDLLGTKFSIKENITNNDGVDTYDIKADFDARTGSLITIGMGVLFLIGAVYSAAILIALIFARKLTKALAKCESPFEENVIKSLKRFSFSLIPMGIVLLGSNSMGIVVIILVFAFCLLANIFSYGAQLQQESDETL